MGRLAYYSPFFVGTLLAAVVFTTQTESLSGIPVLLQILLVLICAPFTGIKFQIIMMGFQGVMAKVIPVPWGRSLRGPTAVLIGSLILLSTFGIIVCILLYHASATLAYQISCLCSSLCYIAALVVYLRSIPRAVRDF